MLRIPRVNEQVMDLKDIEQLFNEKRFKKAMESNISHILRQTGKRTSFSLTTKTSDIYTDGKKIVVGLPEEYIGMNYGEIYSMVKACVGHESAHVKWSNFNSIKPYLQEVAKRNVSTSLGHSMFNIIEDGRIERLLCEDLPGYIKHIKFLNLKLIKKDGELKDTGNVLANIIGVIHFLAVLGVYPTNYKQLLSKKETDLIESKIHPLVLKGVMTNSYSVAQQMCLEIIDLLKDYIPEQKSMPQELMDLLEALAQESYQSSEGKDGEDDEDLDDTISSMMQSRMSAKSSKSSSNSSQKQKNQENRESDESNESEGDFSEKSSKEGKSSSNGQSDTESKENSKEETISNSNDRNDEAGEGGDKESSSQSSGGESLDDKDNAGEQSAGKSSDNSELKDELSDDKSKSSKGKNGEEDLNSEEVGDSGSDSSNSSDSNNGNLGENEDFGDETNSSSESNDNSSDGDESDVDNSLNDKTNEEANSNQEDESSDNEENGENNRDSGDEKSNSEDSKDVSDDLGEDSNNSEGSDNDSDSNDNAESNEDISSDNNSSEGQDNSDNQNNSNNQDDSNNQGEFSKPLPNHFEESDFDVDSLSYEEDEKDFFENLQEEIEEEAQRAFEKIEKEEQRAKYDESNAFHEGINVEEINSNYSSYRQEPNFEFTYPAYPVSKPQPEFRMKIHGLKKTFEKMLKNDESHYKGQKRGRLDTGRLWRLSINDDSVFKKKTVIEKTDYAVEILFDISGSMCNRVKYKNAVGTAICIESALMDLEGVEVKTVAFNFTSGTRMKVLKDFKDKESKTPSIYNTDITGGCNRDGFAIRVALNELKKHRAKNKLLIVISDGMPSSGMEGTQEALADVKDAVHKGRKDATIVSILINDGPISSSTRDVFHYMYEDKGSIMVDVVNNPEDLMKNIVLYLKKMFRR